MTFALAAQPSASARPERPIALNVIPEGIPAELRALDKWVCWRYEWDAEREKWNKIPYTPYTTRKAKSNQPSTCRSFADAYACYCERSDFFDGVFFLACEDDPYVVGDFDHVRNPATGAIDAFAQDHLPDTYAEDSPSGDGWRFIAIATIPKARKRPKGELYSSKRFVSFTGHILEGQPTTIRPAQAAINRLFADLGGRDANTTDGKPGTGDRAELLKAIPESEWDAARLILRTERDRLIARYEGACRKPDHRGEETQAGCLLRGDYAAFHRRWWFVGIYRSDGSVDESQVRAVRASSIRGRGFTFPEFVVIMSYYHAAYCLSKWGTKERWREELAALWNDAPAPRYSYTPQAAHPARKKPSAPRGRAGNHSTLIEQVYQQLLDARAGEQAIVKTAEIAAERGIDRRTVASILQELRDADRITTRRLGQHSGLVVSFSDGIYSAVAAPVCTVELAISDVIYSSEPSAVCAAETPQIAIEPMAAIEDTRVDPVFLQDRPDDHSSESPAAATEQPEAPAASSAVVEPPSPILAPPAAPPLADLVRAALAALPRERVNAHGEIKPWPRTTARVLDYLVRLVPFYTLDMATLKRAVPILLARFRKEQRNAEFQRVHALESDTLNRKIAALEKTIGTYEHLAGLCNPERGPTDPCNPEVCRRFGIWDAKAQRPTRPAWSNDAERDALRDAWLKAASKRRGQLAMHTRERAERDAQEDRREGHTLQQERLFLDLVDDGRLERTRSRVARAARPADHEEPPKPSPLVDPPIVNQVVDTGEMMRQRLLSNLLAQAAQRTALSASEAV